MRKVEIHHQAFDPTTGCREGFVHVANYTTDQEGQDALDQAWRWTNNIGGSWSRGPGPLYEGELGALESNPDYSPNIEVLVPIPTYMGKTYGLRSSMIGDRFVLDGVAYLVASCGFELESAA